MLVDTALGSLLERLLSHTAWTHTVEFSEVDAAGIVNYSAFFCYVDEAFLRWWVVLPHRSSLPGQRLGVVTASVEFSWLKALRWRDKLQVSFCIGPIRRTSFEVFVAITNFESEDLCFLGRLVQVHEKAGRPTGLPLNIRGALRTRQVSDDDWESLCGLLHSRKRD